MKSRKENSEEQTAFIFLSNQADRAERRAINLQHLRSFATTNLLSCSIINPKKNVPTRRVAGSSRRTLTMNGTEYHGDRKGKKDKSAFFLSP